MSQLTDLANKRRSIRVVGQNGTFDADKLQAQLKDLVNALPTAFDMQNTRVVLLLGDENRILWNDIVLEALRPKVKPEKFAGTEKKIAGFTGGFGTLLYFNDVDVTAAAKEKMPSYAENFDSWELQHNGMLQIMVWHLLVEQGYAASLQHYNPLVDDAVKQRWGLPQSWQLLAQMPFGSAEETPGPKEYQPISKRFKVFGQ